MRRRRRRSGTGPSLLQALTAGWRRTLEVGDYARSLVGVHADRASHAAQRATMRTAIAAVAALGVGTIVVAASLRLVVGASDGLARLFGGRAWLGDLSAAVLLLGGLALAARIYMSRRERKELEEHLEKYERRHREHRARHGHFVGDP